jgi:hypothetical protein
VEPWSRGVSWGTGLPFLEYSGQRNASSNFVAAGIGYGWSSAPRPRAFLPQFAFRICIGGVTFFFPSHGRPLACAPATTRRCRNTK